MLSGETATGMHPHLVVETMRKIIMEVERTDYRYNLEEVLQPQPHSPSFLSDAVCYNACNLAKNTHADALIGMTQSGYTGFMLSSYRPKAPLYIFSKERSLVNQRSEEHTSELQSRQYLVCRLLLEKKKTQTYQYINYSS